MTKNNKAQSALPYVRRLLEDEYVQEQLRGAAQGLRSVYERARKERGKATEDKHLYGNLRHAATSIRNAATALQRPKPEPKKKRRLGKIAVLAFAVGGSAWLVMRLQKHQGAPPPAGDAATVAGAPAAGTGSPPPAPEPQQPAASSPPQA